MNLNYLHESTDYTDFHELYFNSFYKKYNENIRVNSWIKHFAFLASLREYFKIYKLCWPYPLPISKCFQLLTLLIKQAFSPQEGFFNSGRSKHFVIC